MVSLDQHQGHTLDHLSSSYVVYHNDCLDWHLLLVNARAIQDYFYTSNIVVAEHVVKCQSSLISSMIRK